MQVPHTLLSLAVRAQQALSAPFPVRAGMAGRRARSNPFERGFSVELFSVVGIAVPRNSVIPALAYA